MTGPGKNPFLGNILIGLFCIAAGIFPLLATFNIGPLVVRDINGPAWLGIASGGIFVAAGFIVMLGASAPVLKNILGLSIVGGLAAIANWIAFGLGERVCSGSFSFFGILGQSSYTDLACRIPFGFGAIVMDGLLFAAAVALLQKLMGDSPGMNGLKKLSEWVIFISLSPILVPFLLVLVARAAVEAAWIRLKTGSWPRNESFIRRQKEKRFSRIP